MQLTICLLLHFFSSLIPHSLALFQQPTTPPLAIAFITPV
ncbi:MAG: hypothetical protein OFPII_26590 [Osedax symbiont Rs1]|nr:MAG: hypothetical protein OFPII_26590 [Osedax symbiont Rs1]